MQLTVRPPREDDIRHVVAYWCDATDDEWLRRGADPARRPTPERLAEGVRATGRPEAKHAYSIWEVDGRAIGYACLKDIEPGHTGSIHLHIWDAGQRKHGLGARLFCLSVVDLYAQFDLKSMICEPAAANPAPNRMLSRIGFRLVESRYGRSSDLSAQTQLNRYDIQLAVATAYVRA